MNFKAVLLLALFMVIYLTATATAFESATGFESAVDKRYTGCMKVCTSQKECTKYCSAKPFTTDDATRYAMEHLPVESGDCLYAFPKMQKPLKYCPQQVEEGQLGFCLKLCTPKGWCFHWCSK